MFVLSSPAKPYEPPPRTLFTTMALKRLLTEEMLAISAPWLDPASPAHAAIAASSDLAPQLPKITAAHQDLATIAQPTADNPRLGQIIEQQSNLDIRHDDILRGTYGLLTGTAHLLGNHGAPLLELRDLLLPDGLASLQKSFRAEAGQAQQLEDRLTPALRTLTDKIMVGSENPQSLTHFLEEWITLGKQLGDLEDEKAQLVAPVNAPSAGAALVAARNKWVRTVNLFVAIADAAELDPATYQLILSPLQLAKSKAEKRGRPDSPAPAPAPSASGTP